MRKRIAIFLWRRAVRLIKQSKEKPVGIPGQRDPDHPCEFYAPGKISPYAFQDCKSDGHYLCKQCYHYELNKKEV